jgi:hypothetical protein
MDLIDHQKTIIATDPTGRVYVQIINTYDLNGNSYKGMRYEIWASLSHYKAGIRGDGRRIYCQGISSTASTEEFLREYYREGIPQ